MLDVFGFQNKTLDVKSWEVFQREEREDGTILVVGLDDLSLTKDRRRKVFFEVENRRIGKHELEQLKKSNIEKGLPRSPLTK